MNTDTRTSTTTVYWINDPGHGWLAVSLEAYPDAWNYGTGFGYEDGRWIYLEEDVEAAAFLMDHLDIAKQSSTGQLAEKSYDFDAPVRRLRPNMAMLDYDAYMQRRRAELEANA